MLTPCSHDSCSRGQESSGGNRGEPRTRDSYNIDDDRRASQRGTKLFSSNGNTVLGSLAV